MGLTVYLLPGKSVGLTVYLLPGKSVGLTVQQCQGWTEGGSQDCQDEVGLDIGLDIGLENHLKPSWILQTLQTL